MKSPLRINVYTHGTYAGCATLPALDSNAEVLAAVAQHWAPMDERVQKNRDGYATSTFAIQGTLTVTCKVWDEPKQFDLDSVTLDVTKHLSTISLRSTDWELHIYNINRAKFEELANQSTATC